MKAYYNVDIGITQLLQLLINNLRNSAGVQCAQCIHVQALKGVAARQPDGSDLRLMQWDDW